MPVNPLPAHPNLDHLKHQAKDLLRDHAARGAAAAQRLREFHPRFKGLDDAAVFAAKLSLSEAQLAVARERGYASWARLKRHVESSFAHQAHQPDPHRPHHQRIADPDFRRAVGLLDAGDAEGLREHLRQHPQLARQRVSFEGENYFQNPSLLEFVAENPIRNGKLPGNIVEIARVLIDAGTERLAMNDTLGLVCSGRVARECCVQIPLIELLCAHGADPHTALYAALGHGEFEAVHALVRHGAQVDLAAASALGDIEAFQRLLEAADPPSRHRALAWAAQFGHAKIVRLLLDAGEDPDRYNPPGTHSHSTPLHQAALAGHEAVVRLLVERGARLDTEDILWHGTPAGWAAHAGNTEIEAYLLERKLQLKPTSD